MIALAILVHGFARPGLDPAATQKMIEKSVAQAVADTEQQHQKQLEEVLANYEEILKQNRLMYASYTGLVRN